MDHMEGYVFNSEEEKQQTAAWFEKHADEIPSMDTGARINGDPILYLGIPEDWQLRALMPDQFEGEEPVDTTMEDRKNSLTNQLMRKAVVDADLSPMQAWVLVLRAFNLTWDNIARTLHITRQSALRAEQSAIRKVNVRFENQ
jgi:DNA-directed RNA polymerase sigma subunit (sigma70/sigma32)